MSYAADILEVAGDLLLPEGAMAVGTGEATGESFRLAPGKGGLGTFSPRLDAAGNSVRGQRLTRDLSDRLGLNLFASRPEPGRSGVPSGG